MHLKELSSNHTVIVFDNRGVGNTTTGNKPFSIHQFANDAAGLLDALNIEKADVLGFSLGSLVAQQLAVMHPEKIIRLILVAASCGGKESIPPSPQVLKMSIDIANKSANDIPITPQEVKALLALGLGSGWIKLHPSYLEYHQPSARHFSSISTFFCASIASIISARYSVNTISTHSTYTISSICSVNSISPIYPNC